MAKVISAGKTHGSADRSTEPATHSGGDAIRTVVRRAVLTRDG
jgi:hypothetical protein